MLDQMTPTRQTDAPLSAMAGRGYATEGICNRSPTSADFHVGRRIKELRRHLGITQKQIAWRIGVTGAQFHRYEAGATRVATSRLMAIADALGVPADRLIREASNNPAAVQDQAVEPQASNDLVELLELFNTLLDQRRRAATLAFARSLAPQPASELCAQQA